MIAALVAMSLFGAPVDEATALKLATNFLDNNRHNGMINAPLGTGLELKKAEPSRVPGSGSVFYIYATRYSYVIVAGDDRAEQILAYGDYALDVNNMPPGMKDMLSQYKDEIEYLQKNPALKVDPIVSPRNTPSLKSASVEPLLTCNWDQGAPFWDECIFGGYQCYSGCPATSAAMVFYYWKYPQGPVPALPGYASIIYYVNGGVLNYNHSPLPSITFDWDNMIDNYTDGYTPEQGAAVAALMHYIGHAERIEYGTPNTGGSGVNSDSVQNIADAFTLLGYDFESVRLVKKTSDYSGSTTLYTDAEWAAILQEELFVGRPVVFAAMASDGHGGHAFNVDGYDSSTNKYHVNFGWSGSNNDWYALNAFQGKSSAYAYNVYQQMVIGIQPPQGPTIQVYPTKFTMEAFVDQSSNSTIVVKGQELTSAIAVTLNDESGYFSIDASSVALNELEDGKSITVTYAPEAVGTHTATITLTNADATTRVISITGKATLDTYKPVMLPIDSTHVNLTQFRADWTDQTAGKYVDSYTLQVSTKRSPQLLSFLDFSDYPQESGNQAARANELLPEGWTLQGGLWLHGGCIGLTSGGSITSPEYDLFGYDKVTVVVSIKASSSLFFGKLTISTSQDSQDFTGASSYVKYTSVLECSEAEKIVFLSSLNVSIRYIWVYAGEPDEATLRAITDEGDTSQRLITGITSKNYTIKDLEAGGTFYYRVKALYTDGTESPWSNIQMVTLFENDNVHEPGDVNHDGVVNVTDITALIAAVLNNGEGVCLDCADLTGDSLVNITDVTELINIVLNSSR